MTLNSLVQEIQQIDTNVTNINSQISHVNDLIEQYIAGDTSVKAQIDFIMLDAKNLLDGKDELSSHFEDLSLSFQKLFDTASSLEDNLQEASDFKDQSAQDQICIKFSDFQKLLQLGNIEVLEGTVTYSHRHDPRESSKSGQTFNLKLNDYGKVRPPIDRLEDEDDLVITNIQINAKNGSFFSFHDVQAFLSVFVK